MSSILRIRSGKATLATEVIGHGHSVVFLHANICDKRMWRAQLDAIAMEYQAIAYDRRGFGETQVDEEDYSAVADLLAVVNSTAGTSPVVLVGCSQGAKIALDATLMHPSRVCGLVLISPTVSGAPEASYPPELLNLVEQQKRAEKSGDRIRLNEIKARLFLDGPMALEGRVKGHIRHLFSDMNGIALRSSQGGHNQDDGNAFCRLQEITIPAQVIWGKLDFPHIQERAGAVSQLLPHGQGYELPGAAHLASLDQPDAVTDLILKLARRCL